MTCSRCWGGNRSGQDSCRTAVNGPLVQVRRQSRTEDSLGDTCWYIRTVLDRTLGQLCSYNREEADDTFVQLCLYKRPEAEDTLLKLCCTDRMAVDDALWILLAVCADFSRSSITCRLLSLEDAAACGSGYQDSFSVCVSISWPAISQASTKQAAHLAGSKPTMGQQTVPYSQERTRYL